jgi:LPS sulfotransferase NodH
MNIIKRINSNNFTFKRLKIEISKIFIDFGLLKGKTDYQKFIILARSRVGSNLLISYLNSHPNIHALGEMFGNNHKETVINYRKANPVKYINELCFREYGSYIKAVGFKIFYYHPVKGESRAIWDELKNMKDLKIIHLKRENILRTHLSRAIAGQTDKWTVTTENNIPVEKKKVVLSKEECLQAFEQTRNWEKEFDEYFSGHQVINMKYEDLITDNNQELERVTEFLNLPLHKLETTLKKQNPEPLNNLISNYPELKEHFKDTEWKMFFED